MNKKAEWKIQPGIVWAFLIIVLVLVTMWVSTWECKNNNDCQSDEICTVKHTCFKPTVSETTIIKTENKYFSAAVILGICIIIAAIILRTEDFKLSHHIHRFRRRFSRK